MSPERLDDGCESLDGGGALGRRGRQHHNRLGSEHQLPQNVKALQQGQQGGKEVGRGRHEAAQPPTDGDRLVGVVGVAGGVGRNMQLHHGTQHWQGQVLPCTKRKQRML